MFNQIDEKKILIRGGCHLKKLNNLNITLIRNTKKNLLLKMNV